MADLPSYIPIPIPVLISNGALRHLKMLVFCFINLSSILKAGGAANPTPPPASNQKLTVIPPDSEFLICFDFFTEVPDLRESLPFR